MRFRAKYLATIESPDSISIPPGAIKSGSLFYILDSYKNISIPSGAIKRQTFLPSIPDFRQFQFLLVRLRAASNAVLSAFIAFPTISIPSGAIKRREEIAFL